MPSSIYNTGYDYYSQFEDFVKTPKGQRQPQTPNSAEELTSPKFPQSPRPPLSPPPTETQSGPKHSLSNEDGQPVQNARPPPVDNRRYLTLPSADSIAYAKELAALESYPQIEGGYDVVSATNAEIAMTSKFMDAFNYWVLLARLFFRTRFYQIQWEGKEKFDLNFMELDPILLAVAGQPSLYVQLVNVGIPSIANCDLDEFDVKVSAERSKRPYPDRKNRYRTDTVYTITSKVSCVELQGKASYLLVTGTPARDPDATKGNIRFTIEDLNLDIGVVITKIDEAFVRNDIRFRSPKISLSYDLKNVKVTVDSVPESSGIVDPTAVERLFNDYASSEIVKNAAGMAERLKNAYTLRVAPLIMQLRWIHQLHDVMNFAMINQKDKRLPEFTVLQTKLVEVAYFSVLHSKLQKIIFTALKERTFEPFEKIFFLRTAREQRTVNQLYMLEANEKANDHDSHDTYADIIDDEYDDDPNKFTKIVTLNYYLIKFFTESILV